MIPFYTEKADRARKQAKEFGEWLEPRDRAIESNQEISAEVLAALWEKGYYSYLIPKEFGGQGGNLLELALILEELAPRSGSVSLSILIQALGIILLSQDREAGRKAGRLAQVVNERKLLAFALSEQGKESAETRAVESEGGYCLKGRKVYVNQGREADWILVLAKTKAGSGIWLTRKGDAGILIAKELLRPTAAGLSWVEVLFNEVRTDAENLVVEPEAGQKITELALARAGVLVAAMALGLIEAGMNSLGKDGLRFFIQTPGWERLWGEARVEAEAGRALCYQAGFSLDKEFPGAERMAVAGKIFLTELAPKLFSRLLELSGPEGIRSDLKLHRWFEFSIMLRALLGSNAFLMENLTRME